MCLNPIKTKNSPDPVPCGKCPKCRDRRLQGWIIRLMQENKKATSSYFLTLTYDESRVPRNEQGYATLNKQDVQKFIKRVRKHAGKRGKGIRYFAVGEYGEQTERPHYHIIIFNAPIDAIEKAWCTAIRVPKNRTPSRGRRKRKNNRLLSQVHVKT